MNLLGHIILVCLVLAALQGLVAVLLIAIGLLLLWGLFFRTEQTVGLIGFCLLIGALQVHPVITIGALVALAGAFLIGRARNAETDDAPEAPPTALPPPTDERD